MKMVLMSDSPTLTTGYGRVIKELGTAFHNAGIDVTVVGWGYDGSPHDLPFNIIGCPNSDRFGEQVLAEVITKQKPDILFTLGDPWMTEFIPQMEERRAVVWFSYFPIDGYPIPPDWHNWIKSCDIPVVFSKFAQELVMREVGLRPILIYHGVDLETFKPLDKQEIKYDYGVGDKFVVGTVARNQPRKNLPALVRAFSIFAKGKEDVALYMHSAVTDVGWDLSQLVKRFGIQDKAFTTANFNPTQGVTDEELVEIYNAFDLFVLPTMAEGFGLPILEAQACGLPVLVTDFSACSELTTDRIELLKVKDTIIMGRNIEQAIVDVDDIVNKLNFFYNDWKKHNGKKAKELKAKGLTKTKDFEWNKINATFIDLVEKIHEESQGRDRRIYPNFYKI